ncbi:M20/M25/M40 family metallo-hydrolase [bacterium]|nr:M20/M25/M40 family metallo-hydrolase [bacterium]
MKNTVFCLSLIIILHSLAAGEGLTPLEKQIAEKARNSAEEAISLLEKVVNINSGTMNHEGVAQVGSIFSKEFEALGFEVRWILQKEVNRAGHLFAERKGNAGKRLILIGHLDTVFEKESSFQPFTRKGKRATGQGVNDMKGGDVIALYALKALHETGALENARIIVAFTGDEEMPGEPLEISRKDLLEAGKRTDIALGFESAEGLNTGTIARRGIGSWTLTVKGMQAHSSGIFDKKSGYGAIFEASRILNAFRTEMAGEQYLTFNPGVIVGGTEVQYDAESSKGTAFGKTNVIARTVTAQGDLRCISEAQQEKARERMRKIVVQSLPGTSAEISFDDGYPGMEPTEGNKKLLQFFDRVSRDLGFSAIVPFDPGKRGAADISFIAKHVDGLDGLGAMGEGGHSPEEDIDLEAIPVLLQRAAILIYRLTHTDGY